MITTLINGTYSITAADGASLVFANISGGLSLALQNSTGGVANQWWIESDSPAYTVKSALYDLYIAPSGTQDASPGGAQQLVPSPEPFGWYVLPDDESFALSPDATYSTFWNVESKSPNTTDVVLSPTRSLWTLETVSATSSTTLPGSPTAASSLAHSSSSLSIAAIAGIAAGGICVVALLVALAIVLYKKNAGDNKQRPDRFDQDMEQFGSTPQFGNVPQFGAFDCGYGPGITPPTAVYTDPYRAQYRY